MWEKERNVKNDSSFISDDPYLGGEIFGKKANPKEVHVRTDGQKLVGFSPRRPRSDTEPWT